MPCLSVVQPGWCNVHELTSTEAVMSLWGENEGARTCAGPQAFRITPSNFETVQACSRRYRCPGLQHAAEQWAVQNAEPLADAAS